MVIVVRRIALERPALTGVLVREVVNYSSYWRASAFSSTVEPTLYLLAFGFGFGSIVSTIGGYDYVEFVGTGTVATAVLFSSAFPAMFGTYVKYAFQQPHSAITLRCLGSGAYFAKRPARNGERAPCRLR